MNDIKTIGIIGAGIVGREIAYMAAAGAYRVVLEDVSRDRLADSLVAIGDEFGRAIQAGQATAEMKARGMASIMTAQSVEDVCREADLLIEATAEEMEAKLEIFTLFDKFAKPGTVLATTTTSLSVADLAEITFCPENCVGMRFLAVLVDRPRLEIVRAAATSDVAVAVCAEAGRRMGVEVVVTNERADAAARARG